MDFSIIIVNYNLAEEVENCINTLLEHSNGVEFEIILVDNNSREDSIKSVAEIFSRRINDRFIFIQSEENIGFGRACNLAAKEAKGNILSFINPDTIFNENVFKQLTECEIIQAMKEGKTIAGINVSEKKATDYSAGFFPNIILELLNVFLLGRFVEAFFLFAATKLLGRKKYDVDWVMGAALFIAADLFKKIDGFDKDYFLYFEEMDLCKRAMDIGGKVTYLPYIKLQHIGSAGSKKNYYYFTKMFYKGKLLFINKHFNGFKSFLLKKLIYMHFLLQRIFWSVLKYRNREKANGKLRAFNELMKNINSPYKLSNRS